MVIPNSYQLANEQAIATYDFFQFSSSIGYKTFYCTSVSGAYLLTTENMYASTGDSEDPYILGSGAAIDEDLDYQFERIVTLEGDLIANLMVTGDCTSGTQSVVTTITVNIYKVVGSTETLLGTGLRYCDFGSLGAGANDMKTVAIKIPITQTKFEPSTKLRVNLQATSPGASRRIFILTDPANRTSYPYGSGDPVDFASSRVIVPFRVRQ